MKRPLITALFVLGLVSIIGCFPPATKFRPMPLPGKTDTIYEGKGFDSYVFIGKQESELRKLFNNQLDTVHCIECDTLYKEKKYKYVDKKREIEYTITDSTDKIHRIIFHGQNFITSKGLKVGYKGNDLFAIIHKDYGLNHPFCFRGEGLYSPNYYIPLQGMELIFKSDGLTISIFPKDSTLYRELPFGSLRNSNEKIHKAYLDSIHVTGIIRRYGQAGQEGANNDVILLSVTGAPSTFKDTLIYVYITELVESKSFYQVGREYKLTVAPDKIISQPRLFFGEYEKLDLHTYYSISIYRVETK